MSRRRRGGGRAGGREGKLNSGTNTRDAGQLKQGEARGGGKYFRHGVGVVIEGVRRETKLLKQIEGRQNLLKQVKVQTKRLQQRRGREGG